MSKHVFTFGLALGAMLSVGAADAQVLFLDGGYAEFCSVAAHNIGEEERVEVTGSRLGLTPLELCTKAVETADTPFNRAGSYVNRGVLYYAMGEQDLALADFERAIAIRDDIAQAHVNRGYVLVAQERWEQSIEALSRGIELGTEEAAQVHFNRAVANEELGRLRAAYEDYTMAAQLAPDWEAPRRELDRFRVGAD